MKIMKKSFIFVMCPWGFFFITIAFLVMDTVASSTPQTAPHKDILLTISQEIRDSEKSLKHVDRHIQHLQILETEQLNHLQKHREHLAYILGAIQRIEYAATPLFMKKYPDTLTLMHQARLFAGLIPTLKEKVIVTQESAQSLKTLRTELENLKQQTQATQIQLVEKQKDLNLPTDAERAHLKTLASQSETLTDFIEGIVPPHKNTLRSYEASEIYKNSLSFLEKKGKIAFPVIGTLVRTYGEPDGYGSTSKGLSIATHPYALVTTPIDGRILFSGPFRSFQHLLIIDAGHGYHIVLAGMYKVMVARGQFIVAGEPIALMGAVHENNSIPLTGGAGMPICYMEIRRGSIPIDPGPWLDQKTVSQVTQ
jgi:septal ring factor EnvC (AmiA/AmiB activator)